MENKKNKDKLKFNSPSAWILFLSFIVSVATLIIYLIEVDFTDDTLFLLLRILRYSTYVVLICSVYKIIANTLRMIRAAVFLRSNKSGEGRRYYYKSRPFRTIILFVFTAYSIAVILFEAFVVVISRGI